MTSSTKTSSDVWKAIGNQRVAMMTTQHDGALVSRPMASHADEQAHGIFFITDLQSEAAHDLGAAPALNLGYVNESDGTYISVSGKGAVS